MGITFVNERMNFSAATVDYSLYQMPLGLT
jgi:hypothetical protein